MLQVNLVIRGAEHACSEKEHPAPMMYESQVSEMSRTPAGMSAPSLHALFIMLGPSS